MTYSVITISGEIATGKSTITRSLLARLPGWKHVNTGDRFREFCSSKGISIQQVSFLPDEVHREFDLLQRFEAKTRSNFILEGRLAGWLTRDFPHVFRVFCYAPMEVRIQRYMEREDCAEDEAKSEIEYRDERDVLKFRRMYDVHDYREPSFYNLVLDTSMTSPDILAEMILDAVRQ